MLIHLQTSAASLQVSATSSLYYKHIMIINDDSSVINKWLESLTDDTTVVIYDRNMFIIQGSGVAAFLAVFYQPICNGLGQK
jgi:hypothetical protein